MASVGVGGLPPGVVGVHYEIYIPAICADDRLGDFDFVVEVIAVGALPFVAGDHEFDFFEIMVWGFVLVWHCLTPLD